MVKISNFGYKFALKVRGESLKQLLQNLAWSNKPQVRSCVPNRDVGLRHQKPSKFGSFGINLAKRGKSPSATFTKFGVGRESQLCTLMLNFVIVALKMWPYCTKIVKIGNFWCKFASQRKSWECIEKFEYICTPRNIPLWNGTVIVLKIRLLISTSVITNSLIPRAWQKHHKWDMQHMIPSKFGIGIGGPSHFFTPNYFGHNQ